MSELFPVHNSAIVGLAHRDDTLSATPTGGYSAYAVPVPQGVRDSTSSQTGGQSNQAVGSITSGTADYWNSNYQFSAAAQAIIANSTSQNQSDPATLSRA